MTNGPTSIAPILQDHESTVDRRGGSRQLSYSAIVVRQFLRHRAAVVGVLMVFISFMMASVATSVAPYSPNVINLGHRLEWPSAAHWLGTDELGRDGLSRLLVGSRTTLLITTGAVSLAAPIGTLLGLTAGYFGGTTDNLVSRVIDILMALPGFLLAIGIIAALGVGTWNVVIAVAISAVPALARVARGATLSVKAEEYLLAARALGARNGRMMLHHVAPNIFPPLIVQTTLLLATAMLTASSLSFLGLGPQPPTPEWGAMLSTARSFITSAPLLVTFPGLAILIVALSFNLAGDGLRDALDPHLRRSA
jgi:peptide/nickel transport system permease protein